MSKVKKIEEQEETPLDIKEYYIETLRGYHYTSTLVREYIKFDPQVDSPPDYVNEEIHFLGSNHLDQGS